MPPAAAMVPDSEGRSHEVVELSDEALGNEGRHEGAELADELLDSRDGVFQPTSGAVALTPLCLFRGLEVVTGGARCGWVPGRVESSEGPVQVQVFHEGLPVAVHTMTQDGNFNLPVPEAYEEVRVTVSSPSGREELTVRPGDDLYVVLGD